MSYTNTVNKENLDNETCLRIFYISLLNNELELSIEMINFLLHSYWDIEQYVDIKNLNQLELLGIWLNLHKKHVETLWVFD
jgi:hypothetical protein